MAPQAPAGRMTLPRAPIPAGVSAPLAAGPPRPWPRLSAETQLQIAQTIAALLRRIQVNHDAPSRETACADRNEHRG